MILHTILTPISAWAKRQNEGKAAMEKGVSPQQTRAERFRMAAKARDPVARSIDRAYRAA